MSLVELFQQFELNEQIIADTLSNDRNDRLLTTLAEQPRLPKPVQHLETTHHSQYLGEFNDVYT